MAKRASLKKRTGGLFAEIERLRHPRLFIRRMLEEESNRSPWMDDSDEARSWEKLKQWALLAEQGHLQDKETSLDAEFLEKVFGDALGYRSKSESPDEYYREKQFSVPGAGTADGALGKFASGRPLNPMVIIELKDADTDLDHDKFNGRTPVQQLWDYLNQLPDCPWGIVSNYISIRLYHRGAPQRAYEEFLVSEFKDHSRFRQFYYLFERHGLLGNLLQKPRADALLRRTQDRQKEVGPELYHDYNNQRLALVEHLVVDKKHAQGEAVRIAQKILDRIVFVAFCEDRHLLPEKTIESAYTQLPRFYKVTNPRWQNFKALFGYLDEGNAEQGVPGYNGGLFRTDANVDDLELDDKWTHFFHQVGKYDFRDEINVDVLGHLFEQSITELERLRVIGLFGKQRETDGEAAMPKSAQRKRSGIYYTPPDFTRLIVKRTLGALIDERVWPLLPDHGAQLAALRGITVCDPACGSGAFLIAAYEVLEATYFEILRQMRAEGNEDAEGLVAEVPEWILGENLYGVDLSQESVEITQLALWIKSARKGRKLSDLSKHVVWGNSLVADSTVHPKAMVWEKTFPAVFKRGGFDVVIGNPPWEQLILHDREYFSLVAPEIASAESAADRRAMIAELEVKNPKLFARYNEAQEASDRILKYVQNSGIFPLSGKGRTNTYMVFAELARRIVAPKGRVGLLVPSGIATDDTTKGFFGDLIEKESLIALYDFENKEAVFPDVHRSFKFSVLLMSGLKVKTDQSDFVFFARNMDDLEEKERHIVLTAKDFKLLNPNTRTCPIFRSRRDAELTKGIYRRVPILIDESRRQGGNPWGVKFTQGHLNQTSDAELFVQATKASKLGFKLKGNVWVKSNRELLPVYEGKMVQVFDHRAASVEVTQSNWMRQGQPEPTTLVEHQNPEFVVIPRFWCERKNVSKELEGVNYLLGFKDVTSATNQRTMIASMLPAVPLINSVPFLSTNDVIGARLHCCLLANFNSFAYDFVARQKVGGVHLNFFIVEQLPTLPPEAYAEKCPWAPRQTLEKWISDRVLKLTCTAEDMVPLAKAAGFDEGIHRWNPRERAKLMAELDAAYFVLYGVERGDVEYILGTFQGLCDEDEKHDGAGPTRTAILECFDEYSAGR